MAPSFLRVVNESSTVQASCTLHLMLNKTSIARKKTSAASKSMVNNIANNRLQRVAMSSRANLIADMYNSKFLMCHILLIVGPSCNLIKFIRARVATGY